MEESGIVGSRIAIEEKQPVLEDYPFLRYDPSKWKHWRGICI